MVSYATMQLKLTTSMVRHPTEYCVFYWLLILSISTFIALGGYFELDNMLLNDFFVASAQETRNQWALDDAMSKATFFGSDLQQETILPRTKASFFHNINFLFEGLNDETLLTPKNLKEICEIENTILTHKDYKLYCLTNAANGTDTNCLPQITISSMFYGANNDCNLMTTEQINNIFSTLVQNSAVENNFQGENIEMPTITRSSIILGGPLGDDTPPYITFTETEMSTRGEQADGYALFFQDVEKALFTYFDKSDSIFSPAYASKHFQTNDGTLKTRMYGYFIEQKHFQKVVLIDQQLSFLSFVAVSIFMYFHIRSKFLTFCAMVAIATTLTVGLFVYELILRIEYFNNLHLVVIYLILGIGADDVFVLVDAWKQTEHFERDDKLSREECLIKRFDCAFSQALGAVLNTSLTTAVAFLATGVSPVKPVAAFGFYAAVVIIVNFIYVGTVHAATLMFYELKVKPKLISKATTCKVGCQGEAKAKIETKSRLLSLYSAGLTNATASLTASLTLTIFGIVMFYQASKLETPVSTASNFKPSHMFTGFMDDFENIFIGGRVESFSSFTAVFGIAGLDYSEVKKFTPSDFRGTVFYEDDFDFYAEECQNYLVQVCLALESEPCGFAPCKHDEIMVPNSTSCFIRDFRAWHQIQFNSSITYATNNAGLDTELTVNEINSRLEQYILTESPGQSRNLGIIEDQVRFTTITGRNSIKQFLPLQVKSRFLDLLDTLQVTLRDEAPASMKSYFHTSFDIVWAKSEIGLVTGLFNGLAISAACAYVVLLIGTRSLIIATVAIFGVTFIVACVLGTAQNIGWSLGTTEAIAGVMVIGLSVDYTIHLAHMLMLGLHQQEKITRVEAVIFSVEKMGGTVIAGAFTTFSSGVFLFLCNMGFFVQMATLITATVSYSLLYAFGFFLPLCRLIGPSK